MVNFPKILFLPRWYPCKDEPLHGIFIQRHAVAVADFAKVIVLFASTDTALTDKLYYYEEFQVGNVSEIKFYYKKKITGIRLIDRFLKIILYFTCIFLGFRYIIKKHGKPQLVHVHVGLRTLIAATCFKFLNNIQFIFTEHWSGYYPEDGTFKGVRKFLSFTLFKHASYILPITQHLKKAMINHGINGEYKIVPNVVDLARFKLSQKPVHNQNITAIHISNFDERSKNIKGIVEVINIVSKKRNDFKLKIVGSGENQANIKKLCAELGLLNNTVFFTGPLYNIDLVSEIQKCDFLFIFSNYEGQPCVIAEAMACGKPVLATLVGGIPEMVSEDTGILSPAGDVELMAEKFIQMLNSCKNFDPEIIRKNAEEKYSYGSVGKQILNVYQDVLK